ncbi:CotH kinase family protein [Paenibacillus allorhizosphaerae]|uniref:Inner spore coat protein H n=1 Tax=Paenibacillus allorhizosphaerae TaxID=2849866 RepID=A0ABM8VRE8_9BACL|nr:CotH kinase family protein [Paenibacillus allorhizosphaerae]CAG7655197.1 Inner spore coat protein H [Paenibacillus allorhizosphaerae]
MPADIPVCQIWVHEEQLKRLQRNVWSDRFVPAAMTRNGEQAPILMRYRGGHTREYPKRSYEIAISGKTYHYNAEYDDPSLIRNALSFRFFEWIGVPAPSTRHCLLYLNGHSLGVYLEIESVDRRFFRKRGIGAKALFYASNDNANFGLRSGGRKRRKASLFSGYQQMIGSVADRRALIGFVRRLNTGPARSETLRRYLHRRLDIDNYLHWLAGAVFTGNYDGFDQNYALYLHEGTQKYRIIPWDYEGTWGRNCYGKPCGSSLVSVMGYNRLTRRLLLYPSVRKRYKTILDRILKTHFTVQKIVPAAVEMHRSIRPYVYRDSARKWSFGVFDGEPKFIRHYVEERRQKIAEAIRTL